MRVLCLVLKIMRYKFLGRSGSRVSELCLGSMNFGGKLGCTTRSAHKMIVQITVFAPSDPLRDCNFTA
jgi:hypothetical protein